MATEEHRALVQRYVDAANTRDERIIDDLFAEDYVMHLVRGDVPGRDGVKRTLATFGAGFPDWRVRVDEVLSAGDRVIYRWTIEGTHQGSFHSQALGRTLSPTGRAVTLRGIHIQRVADGRFAEAWTIQDTLGLLQQLGAIPTPGQAG